MRKTRKDFEEMEKKNSELEEAYDVLDKLSSDEKKRLEYETRQRAIRDYNIGMLTAERRGIEAGRKIGREEGENCPRPVRKCEWGILLCSGEPERGHARSLEGIKWGTLRERRGKQPDGTGNLLRKEGRTALQSGR